MSENSQSSGELTPRPKTENSIIIERMMNHPLTHFDEKKFVDLLEHSLSLSVFEKKNVIDQIPHLSQLQIDKLIEVFEDERVEFRNLVPTEGEFIRTLVVKAQNGWEELKEIYVTEDKNEQQIADDLKKAEELKKNF